MHSIAWAMGEPNRTAPAKLHPAMARGKGGARGRKAEHETKAKTKKNKRKNPLDSITVEH